MTDNTNPLDLPPWFLKMAHDRIHTGTLSRDQQVWLMDEFKALWAAIRDMKEEHGETLFRFDYEYERGRIMGEPLYTHKQVLGILGCDTITGRPWSPDLLRIHLVAVTEQDVRTFERANDD